MKKNLVLGVAKGYGWDSLEPFIISFVKNCPNAELILFVDDISEFTRDKLIRAKVTLKEIPAEYKEIAVVISRWKMYADFLKVYGDKCEQIFITDTADVVFQGNVFKNFKSYSNYLGYATEADDIRGSKTGDSVNYDWLTKFFDKSTAERLADCKIICAGTIIGTTKEIKIFCVNMWNALKDRISCKHDQFMMNYLFWNGLLPIKNFIEIDFEHGEIFTMGLADNFSIRGKSILRPDGGVPAVVHQYNRQESLIQLTDRFYRDKNFKSNSRFADTRSVIEQATCLLYADKIDLAAQLFIGKFLVTDDFSKVVNALLNLWGIAFRKPYSKIIGDIEAAVQIALKSVGTFSQSTLEKICKLLKYSAQYHHFADQDLKNSLVNAFFKTAEQKLAANELNQCRYCLDLIKLIEPNPSKDFYLLEAKLEVKNFG